MGWMKVIFCQHTTAKIMTGKTYSKTKKSFCERKLLVSSIYETCGIRSIKPLRFFTFALRIAKRLCINAITELPREEVNVSCFNDFGRSIPKVYE